MPGCKVDINGVEATLFKDTDPPIYLMPDGRFAMMYGGLWKIRGSVKPLLVLLNRFQAAVKLMKTDRLYEPSVDSRDTVDVIEAVAWERGIIGLKSGKRLKYRYDHWYEFNATVKAELEAVYDEVHKLRLAHARAFRELLRKHSRICKKLKPVTEGNFRNIIAGIDSIRPRAKVKRDEAN